MNITKKKLYYAFFDLWRASSFLEDSYYSSFASDMVEKIMQIKDEEFDRKAWMDSFNPYEQELIREFLVNRSLCLVNNYVNKIPTWLWLIIKPDFFDLNELRSIIKANNICSKTELCRYFCSNDAIKKYGKEMASLYFYFVQNQDGSDFPMKYRIFPNDETELLRNINGIAIKGNFHNHSLYSDGRCDIQELREHAQKAGRKFVGISDHSQHVGGVTPKLLVKQMEEIDTLNKTAGVNILKSIECEILFDGSLDLDDDILSKLDYVIIAVHRDELMKKSEATRRLIKAIENENANILAHPSSRLYQRKVGLYTDIHKVIEACVRNNVAIEINGDPDRLDLAPEYIKYAIECGAMFTVDSDTHNAIGFKNINNALRIAADNSIPTDKILNTKSAKELHTFFNK
ncbi:PHP domain-containing protein [Bacteroides fragilis]|uniref:PHP domain-containing protein n=1 Tax=Bacteroides fragilis TaxID=817 RepID=UPI0022AA4BBA|nr:PHP domain-containing protein [Bacteroides fragilis]MCZ2695827.1 PHP domain-containing protein [Bacteroides fragilis]